MEGDFRLEEIKDKWKIFFQNNKNEFLILNIKVKCKSGTYMRVLAKEIGGFAFSIIREVEF